MTKPSIKQIDELIKMRYSLTDLQTASVLELAQNLSESFNKPNDYAIAKELSERASKIIMLVADYTRFGNLKSFDGQIKTINRQYVLLSRELKNIYERNPELNNISIDTQTPIWDMFDVVEGNEYEISEFIHYHGNNAGLNHNAQINKLLILSNIERPTFTKFQKKLIEQTDLEIETFTSAFEKAVSIVHKTDVSEHREIPGYNLFFADNGSIIINNVLRLKKTQSGSAPRKLMEQATRHPNELFKPNLGAHNRKLTSILSDMGIKGALKTLFFPTISDDAGIKFRPNVSRELANKENIDTRKLDEQLVSLNAKTERTTIELSEIPF